MMLTQTFVQCQVIMCIFNEKNAVLTCGGYIGTASLSAVPGSTGPQGAGAGKSGCGKREVKPCTWSGRTTPTLCRPSPSARMDAPWPAGAMMARSGCGRSNRAGLGRCCRDIPPRRTAWPFWALHCMGDPSGRPFPEHEEF
jgi:hypothetical protein